MKEIEEELTNIHQRAREQKSHTDMLAESAASSAVNGGVHESMEPDRQPFALVDRVDPGSPAAYGVSTGAYLYLSYNTWLALISLWADLQLPCVLCMCQLY